MNYFLDTSALFKLYHFEEYTSELKTALFTALDPSPTLVNSQLAFVEFAATAWKKTRSKQSGTITLERVAKLLLDFENDRDKYVVVELETGDYESARRIVNRSNAAGYPSRSLDGLQLAAATKLQGNLDLFVTFDKQLQSASTFCGLTNLFIPPLTGSGVPSSDAPSV